MFCDCSTTSQLTLRPKVNSRHFFARATTHKFRTKKILRTVQSHPKHHHLTGFASSEMMNTTQEVEMNPESEAKRKKKVLKKKIKSSSNPVGDSEYIEYRRSGSSERHQSPPVYYPPPPPNYQMPYYPHPSSPFGYYPPPSGVPYDYNRGYVPPTQSSSSSADDYIYDQNSGKFYFKPRRETLNWRVLLQLDVEKIMDQVDIDTLESVTKNVTFSRIDYNDLRYFNETNFVQVFRISQLIIEYLLYVQNYLSTKK